MGLMKRFSMIFKSKASKAMDRYEDPRETLDYSYERTLQMLQNMRRGVADVATSRKRIELQAQHDQLKAEEAKMVDASQRLQAKVEAFRTRKETMKASYTAAEAQTKVNEAISGISEEMGDVGLAMQRAEDKVAQMQARAGAMDELMASGALDDASTPLGGRDDIQRELDSMSAGSDVELELAKLKGELPAGQKQQALPGA